ncbi:hypothetical protein [uncultured Flavobacterium sp.]|uniref:hypothetical protein n=1 Tax=uncultured Flavobacterium sp. TaxID=165435 RepID=UPI0030C8A5F7
MKIPLFIIISLIFINCRGQKSISKSNCKCYVGIGSDEKSIPIYKFSFNNGQKISICGYNKDDILSEFNVFDCSNGNLLTEYGATQNCKIEFYTNQLDIFELDTFPSGKNWEWEVQKIALQRINQINNHLVVHLQVPLNLTHHISIEEQILFLDSFKTMDYTKFDTEELIGRLETLALTHNIEAEKILYNLKNDSNIILDGAIKEQYNNAIAKINWMKI